MGPWDLQQKLFDPRSDFGKETRSLFSLHGHRAARPGPTLWSKLAFGLSLQTLLGARWLVYTHREANTQSVLAFKRKLIYSQHPKRLVEFPLQQSNTFPSFPKWTLSINKKTPRNIAIGVTSKPWPLGRASQATSAPFVGIMCNYNHCAQFYMTPTQSVCLSPSAFEQGNTRARATPISKVISCQEKGKGRRGRENQILICTNNQSPSTRRMFERREIQLQALPSRGAGLKSRPARSRGWLLRASLLQLSTSKADHLGEHSKQKQLLKMHMKHMHSYLSLQLDNALCLFT